MEKRGFSEVNDGEGFCQGVKNCIPIIWDI